MGRRSQSQKELGLPNWRQLSALREFVTYQGSNDTMLLAKEASHERRNIDCAHLLQPRFLAHEDS
jgi:hypothetical protein